MPEPMAIPCDKSSVQRGTRAPMIDSELVRTCLPKRLLMLGNEPFSLSRKRSSMVPSDDAEKTTARQVNLPGCFRIHVMELTVRISYPPPPSLAPAKGLSSITFVSGKTTAPYFSARERQFRSS